MSTPRDVKDWREARRLRAWELSQQGWKQKTIAQALGVTEGAVSQWLARAREGGAPALRARLAPGAPPRLTGEQRAALPALLLRGAGAFGFVGEVWTAARVGAVIEREWGVRYHPGHVAELLKSCGWSRQRPARRARQRDAGAIKEWQEARLPALKKRP